MNAERSAFPVEQTNCGSRQRGAARRECPANVFPAVHRIVGHIGLALLAGAGCGSDAMPANEPGVTDQADSDSTMADGVEASGSDGGEDPGVRDVLTDADVIADEDTLPPSDGISDADIRPDADVEPEPDVQSDVEVDPDPDIEPDSDVAAEPIGCADLNCSDEGRACVESDGTADAECGDCLAGFVEVAGECEAPSCRGDGDCTPDPIADEWGSCGGYETSCSVDGTQTRLVYAGQCVSGRCEVTSVEQSRPCLELRQTEGDPCVVGAAVGECRSGTCAVIPGQVTGVSASDGTSPAFVRVVWPAVEGATGYNVYRDGELLTATPIAGLSYEDRTAPAGAVPERVTNVTASSTTDSVTLSWSAAAAEGSAGAVGQFTVAAVGGAGEGPLSAADPGYRSGFELTGYEIRISGRGGWFPAGVSTTYADNAAPPGTINVGGVRASDGTSAEYVTLSSTVSTRPGASRSYEVRAVNAAGAGAASSSVNGQRTVGTPSLQWQRSSGTSVGGFTDISGATTNLFNDTDAPSDGSTRHYRLLVTAPGAATVTSPSDSGFRQVGGPAPGSIGGTCSADSECPVGSWCSTVSDYRRCSPRLFPGEPQQMDFVFVPAGSFEQGTPGARDQERPYTATLTRSYFVSRTEVTQGQWRAATGGTTNPPCFQSPTGTSCSTSNANDNGPVERIDWYSALAYANWLSSQNGLQQCYTLNGCSSAGTGWYDGQHSGCTAATFTGLDCTGYRLLTESEWERAARDGAAGSTFYWGEFTDSATVGLYAWFSENSGRRTQAVGQKLMNAYGLYDMSGNVTEWVWDWVFTSSDWILYPVGNVADYLGGSEGEYRGLRGGSWNISESELRSAFRNFNVPSGRSNASGFRLGRTLP